MAAGAHHGDAAGGEPGGQPNGAATEPPAPEAARKTDAVRRLKSDEA